VRGITIAKCKADSRERRKKDLKCSKWIKVRKSDRDGIRGGRFKINPIKTLFGKKKKGQYQLL